MRKAVTDMFGKYPARPLFGAGPNSVQLGLAVLLEKTPTSVATYTVPGTELASTTTAFAGESGRFALKSLHD